MNRFDQINFMKPQVDRMSLLDLVIYDLVWLGVCFLCEFATDHVFLFYRFPLNLIATLLRIYGYVTVVLTTIRFINRGRETGRKPSSLPKQKKPDSLPKQKSAPSFGSRFTARPDHPFYVQALNTLEENTSAAHDRRQAISTFLDEYFAGSGITKARYMGIVNTAVESIEQAENKCSRAISLFGSKKAPTPDRIQIVNDYVDNSTAILNRMEKVITELIALEQQATLDESIELENSLNGLAETTRQYVH